FINEARYRGRFSATGCAHHPRVPRQNRFLVRWNREHNIVVSNKEAHARIPANLQHSCAFVSIQGEYGTVWLRSVPWRNNLALYFFAENFHKRATVVAWEKNFSLHRGCHDDR